MGVEEYMPRGILLTAVEKMVNWGRASSVWPLAFGTACCSFEALAAFASRFDMARFVFGRLNMPVNLTACKSSDFQGTASRPLNSRFDCSKIQALLDGPIKLWQEPLERFLEQS